MQNYSGSGHVLLINNSYPSFCVANIMKIGTILIYIHIHIDTYIYIVLKPRDTLVSCFHIIVVQYHILLKKMNCL